MALLFLVHCMEDKHDAAFEKGRQAIKETKEVHLGLDSHSSSYNQIGIMLNIQHIQSLPKTVQQTPILLLVHCVYYRHDNRLGIGTRVIKGTTEVL